MPSPNNPCPDTPTPPPSPTGPRRKKRKSPPVRRQTLIDRLVRAGLTFILLGLAASQLPTDGHVMADTKNCSGPSQDMYRLTPDSTGEHDPALGLYASGSTITLYAFIYDKKSSSWKTFTPTLGTQTDISGSFSGNVYTGTTTSNTTSNDETGSVMVSGPGVTLTDTFTVVGTPVVAPTSNPSNVTGTTANLSSGITYTGTAPLTYAWTGATGTGSAPFTPFSATAANPTVTFTGAGSYAFTVTVSDNYGFSQKSTVSGSVAQTLTTIAINPIGRTQLPSGQTLKFGTALYDQFGQSVSSSPMLKWYVTPPTGAKNYSIDANTGAFTAGTSGAYDVYATSGSVSNSISVTVE